MRALTGLGALALFLAGAGLAHANSSLGIGNAEVTAAPSGILAGPFMEIMRIQRLFFVDLREALVAIRDGGSGGLGWLVGLSFVYGIFHAAGPGHGKAVIASYLMADGRALRRGVALSFASAAVQGLSAVAITAAGWWWLRGSAVTMTEAANVLELGSYAMIAALGAWLLLRKGAALAGRLPLMLVSSRTTGGLAFSAPGSTPGGGGGRFAASGFLGAGDCRGEAACDCAVPHMPPPSSSGPGWRGDAATVLAIGLRPCSGAIVVLTFALLNGLWLGGGLAVAAMALGTAITVSLLAAIAVGSKGMMLRAGRGSAVLRLVLETGGAVVLLALGAGLLWATL
ncbi:nickel/cobalt transporter [Aureimonas jatrophae]|uniref:Nickel/cobalt efflux system n=1 Tax=Aureimonas jatrophae TaxID=1166073 RepID=A0A1H0J6Z3_9HYPH|nr:nickel/cobalt transporter [Aureimonas jatrophae]MBB3951564.1 ABC-type nickel/cobalt efflux system permease component RcnA [Aureimonas jatrophae]SDO39434.1 ABC-type nickel/cobalt efflux system, permease component RcnA [Aureimonas jatrophae]